MKKYYYTYILHSYADNRSYIGSRGSSVLPHKDTKYMSSSKAVTKEYLAKCTKTILKVFSNRHDALMHEVYLHELFNVGVNTAFFNQAKQSSTKFDRSGIPMTTQHKARIGKANKLSRNTPESKEKQRKLRSGAIVSASTKHKLRLLNLGSNSPKAKKVCCIETGTIFGSISEAAQWAKIHYSGIVKVCNGKQNKAGTYTWKYST